MDQPDTPETSTVVTPASMRLKAMDLLARREHSRSELSEKLTTKLVLSSEHMDTLEAVLDRLVADDLLSDERFAEVLVRSKLHKGQGPRRIAQDLRKRGVGAELAASALSECGADWYELAVAAVNKKYGPEPAVDMKGKARRSRFLQYRGFSAEHVANALNRK